MAENNFITRQEIAHRLGVAYKVISRLDKQGHIPGPKICVSDDNIGRPKISYDRAIIEPWIETQEVKDSIENSQKCDSETGNDSFQAREERKDVWGIRKNKNSKRKNFVYSGRVADVILFCQPALLNRGHKFSWDEKHANTQ